MTTRKIILTSILSLFVFLTKAQSIEISLDELKKLYNEYYIASAVDSINWTNKGNCDPGVIPKDIYLKAEKRLNFFRLVNRLPIIKIVDDKQKQAQAAAFLMSKNNILTHKPLKTCKCYSESASDGAANSCLAFCDHSNFPESSFLTGFIDDMGDANYFVGHRRWILYSKAKTFSYGATKNTEALYCASYSTDTLSKDYIAYPWNGYVPHNLIFSKWSFSIPELHQVDFTKMKITIVDNIGNAVPFKILIQNDGFPDKTITWKMTSMFTTEDEKYGLNKLVENGFIGKEIIVQISNVTVDKKITNYKYKVKITKL